MVAVKAQRSSHVWNVGAGATPTWLRLMAGTKCPGPSKTTACPARPSGEILTPHEIPNSNESCHDAKTPRIVARKPKERIPEFQKLTHRTLEPKGPCVWNPQSQGCTRSPRKPSGFPLHVPLETAAEPDAPNIPKNTMIFVSENISMLDCRFLSTPRMEPSSTTCRELHEIQDSF